MGLMFKFNDRRRNFFYFSESSAKLTTKHKFPL